jgi:hypothetical protein
MEPGPVFQANTSMSRDLAPGPMQLTRNLVAIHPAFAAQDSILRDYLRVLIKRIWVVLGALAVVFGATLIASLRATQSTTPWVALKSTSPIQS